MRIVVMDRYYNNHTSVLYEIQDFKDLCLLYIND